MDRFGTIPARVKLYGRKASFCCETDSTFQRTVVSSVDVDSHLWVRVNHREVASAEWKRALRWMVGVRNWEGVYGEQLHRIGLNGLLDLSDWGPKGIGWALNSDRFFR